MLEKHKQLTKINSVVEFISEINKTYNMIQQHKQNLENFKKDIDNAFNSLKNIQNQDSIKEFFIKIYDIYCELKDVDITIENFYKYIVINCYNKNKLNDIMYEINKMYTHLLEENDCEIVFRAPTKEINSIEEETASVFLESFYRNENLIFREFVAKCPQEFENMTTFDKLTKMRHYLVPNRLLDVTYDPFFALFFSCGKKNKEKKYTGSKRIILYIVKKSSIKYFDSDTISVLSALTNLKHESKKKLRNFVDFCKNISSIKYHRILAETLIKFGNTKFFKNEYILNDLKNFFMDVSFINVDIESIIKNNNEAKVKELFNNTLINENIKILLEKNRILEGQEEYLRKLIETYISSNVTIEDKKKINKIFNYLVSNFVSELGSQLKQEKNNWYDNALNLETFLQCYLVKPKMNNIRILAQSGAFFIYPFDNTDIKQSLFKKEPYKIYCVDNVSKIMEELSNLNINSGKYMPDLDTYAKEIREKYN